MNATLSKADAQDRILLLLVVLILLVGLINALDAAAWWLEPSADNALTTIDWILKGGVILVLALVANVLRHKWRHRSETVFEEDSVLMPLMHRAAVVAFIGTLVALQMDNFLGRILPASDVSLVTHLFAAWMLLLFSISFLLMNARLAHDAGMDH